jgi:GNAT superfamily N-acetyltransferase
MADDLRYLRLRGAEILPHVEALGALRLSVFNEYPYLYEGTMEEERDYLATYARAASSLVVLAMDGDRPVGATTCLGMIEGDPSFRACFESQGWQLPKICYLGESVLLPQYRGHGVGKVFFREREDHARELKASWTTFCAVDRPADHPLRPAGYRPLDGFWTAQGYDKHPELQATFVWKEIGEQAESPKTLTFWLKQLAPSS